MAGVLAIAIASSAWLNLTGDSASAGASVGISRQAAAVEGHSAGGAGTSGRTATTAGSRGETGSAVSAQSGSIQLTVPVGSAKPFQAVPIRGTQRDAANSPLQVQRSQNDSWVSFPLPTTTDRSGHFTTYIELGKPGRYWVRVLDPQSGATSNRFLLVVKA